MQQQTDQPAAATQSQGVSTGPGAEATTGGYCFDRPRECAAVVMLHIHRDRVALIATLDMGGHTTVSRTWVADGSGIWRSRDQEFNAAEDRIGVELAEYLDGLDLPFRVAQMLPKPPTAAGAAAMAEAAKEVRRA
ncbi:hypothetical protein ACI2IY_12880 [Lysobacter enzymogenes]|uniref:hypothetical protein n=1 Tax=Lysobacter enzymogenes TaxID=69 RepID=UPI0038508060